MDPNNDPNDSGNGQPKGNQPGNPDPNVQALQKKLTERDLELKKVKEELDEAKKRSENTDATQLQINAMQKTIENLTGEIGSMTTEKKKEELRQKYPDILPELLIGKSDAEIEILATRQREANEKNYANRPSSHEPQYSSRDEVSNAIKAVTADKTMTTDNKLVKIRELKLKMDEF